MKKIVFALLFSCSLSAMAQETSSKTDNQFCSHVHFSGEKTLKPLTSDNEATLKEQQLSIQVELYKEQVVNKTKKLSDYSVINILTINHQKTPILMGQSGYLVAVTGLDGKPITNSNIGLMADMVASLADDSSHVKLEICLSNTEVVPANATEPSSLDTYHTFEMVDTALNSPTVFSLNGDKFLRIKINKPQN